MRNILFKLRYITPFARKNGRYFILGFVLLILTTLFGVMIPWLIKLAIDALTKSDFKHAATLALVMMGVAIIQGVCRVQSRVVTYGTGRKIEYELRRKLYRYMLKLPPSYYDRNRSGDLISRATNDITAIRMFIGPGFLQFASVIITYSMVVPLMFSIDVTLTLLALTPYPVMLLMIKYFTSRLYKTSAAVQEGFGNLSSFVHETVTGINVIKNFHNEKVQKEKFLEINDGYFERTLEQARYQSMTFPFMGMIGGIAGFIILWKGGHYALEGRISIGDFAAFNGYLAMLVWPTIGFGWVLNILQRGLAAMDRVNAVLDKAADIAKKEEEEKHTRNLSLYLSEREKHPKERGSLRLDSLTFGYEGGDEVLRGVSLTVRQGEWAVIVGPISSGKSTLLSLVASLYKQRSGSIFIDGVDTKTIPEKVIKRSVSFVRQESFLFSDTIRKNILFGQRENEVVAWENGDTTLEYAAKTSQIYGDVMEFTNQFETMVGERGIVLSGGQRQRTSIARGAAFEPNIFLFDDSFSSVDVKTEREIVNGIKNLRKRKTIIMTTHRLTSITDADMIYVLEEGKITQSGTHQELMKQGGYYRRNYNYQKLEEEIENY